MKHERLQSKAHNHLFLIASYSMKLTYMNIIRYVEQATVQFTEMYHV